MSYMLSSELADSFVCGAIAHPSIILEQYIHGREPTDLVAKVTKPMLLMPTQVIIRYGISLLNTCMYI